MRLNLENGQRPFRNSGWQFIAIIAEEYGAIMTVLPPPDDVVTVNRPPARSAPTDHRAC